MYPNPQDVLPLPPRPDVEQYRKLAKNLVKACKADDGSAVALWARRWIESLARLHGNGVSPDSGARSARQIEQFAKQKLSSTGTTARCRLADAQFVIARVHGFVSWPKFVTHVESLSEAASKVSAFEAAAQAIVAGNTVDLTRLLRGHPELLRGRSTREHRATLLHYVAANGVENYRQATPENIVEIARLLLAAGSDVDAAADVYGGGCTTLGLVATSVHPAAAGVQRELIDILLDHGARMDAPGIGGGAHGLVRACLANGQPDAARYLADRGAPLDLAGAAGLGRLEVVTRLFDDGRRASVTSAQIADSLTLACACGHGDVVAFLIDKGVRADTRVGGEEDARTGLHIAAYFGHPDVVDVLLRRGAPVNAVDAKWRTPLVWGLTGWAERTPSEANSYHHVVARLVAAGAVVSPDLIEWVKKTADRAMLDAFERVTRDSIG